MYINYEQLDIEKPVSIRDILAKKKIDNTYDDYHYADKTYKRFRTRHVEDDVVIATYKLRAEDRLTYLNQGLDNILGLIAISGEKTTQQFKIPKKTGGWRTITAPAGEYRTNLDLIQTWLKDAFQNYTDQSYAYVPGRSILDAVNRHKDSNWFLKLDLHNFFGSVTPNNLLHAMSYVYPFCFLPIEKLQILINYCCLDGGLPQGTPTSPILTNIFMTEVDYTIQKICDKKHLGTVYTRYADDMLFSAKAKDTLNELVEDIEPCLDMHGLELNKEKTRQGSIAGRNWNLGLMLNKDHNVTVGHKKTRQYKSMLYQTLLRYKDGDTTLNHDWQEINGKLNWFRQIEPDYFEYLVGKYDKLTGVNYYELGKVLS